MVNRVESVFNLLEVFYKNDYPLGIVTFSNTLLTIKGSVFQPISLLEKLECTEKDPHNNKQYGLTTKLHELINISISSYCRGINAHNYLKTISEETGTWTYFDLRNKKNRTVYVDQYASENALSEYTIVGSPLSYHTTHGKVIITFPTLEEIEAIIQDGLEKFTDKTLMTEEALLEELCKIRNQEYAFDDEERMKGVRYIVVSLFNSHKEAISVIGISGLLQNMPDSTMLKHATHIKIGEVTNHMSAPYWEMNLSTRQRCSA